MNDEGQRLDESSSRVVPVDIFQALDAGADISLESFERKLVQTALDKGDKVKAKAKYLQVYVFNRFVLVYFVLTNLILHLLGY